MQQDFKFSHNILFNYVPLYLGKTSSLIHLTKEHVLGILFNLSILVLQYPA